MQLAMVGLGRMGANMVRRLMADGHECVAYDVNRVAVQSLAEEGATGSDDVADLVRKLTPPRHVWLMLPAAFVDATIDSLAPLLEAGDCVIDGGNSYYRDDILRSERLATDGIKYVDVGVSGGVFGLERGFCMMIGGDASAVEQLDPIFESLAPGFDAAPRTAGRDGSIAQEERGYLHCGPAGAGHFVKMVHNGVEYGLMAALAEGFAILHGANAGTVDRAKDAETAPLQHPEYYTYDFDVPAIAELWRRGSVVSSWLVDLTAAALVESPALAEYSGYVADSGEGRWTVEAAVDMGVPAPVITAALYARFASQGADEFGNKVLSAMRKQFGGHIEKIVKPEGVK